MRSSTPPCPGSSVPLSFAPACRFSSDSKRSPTIDTAASSIAKATNASVVAASVVPAKPALRASGDSTSAYSATAASAP